MLSLTNEDMSNARELRNMSLAIKTSIRVLVVVGLLVSSPALAGQGVWTTTGPFTGKQTNALVVDAFHPGTLYAATAGGLYRSADQAQHWSATADPVNSLSVSAVAVSTTALFAGTENGLFRSTDQGNHWTNVSPGFTSPVVNAIAVTSFLYAATADGIFRSSDQGDTWKQIYDVQTFDIALDRHSPKTIYAALGIKGLTKSSDNGDTWTPLVIGGAPSNATLVAAGGGSVGIVYASGTGLAASRDGGNTWYSPVAAPSGEVFGLWVNLDDALVAYAASIPAFPGDTGGVFETQDGGQTWVSTGLSAAISVTADPRSGFVFAGDAEGIWKLFPPSASNPVRRWHQANGGIRLAEANALSLSSTVPPTLYAATEVGVFRSDDGGSTWADAGLFGTALTSIAGDPLDPGVCYAATAMSGHIQFPVYGRIWKTSDGGDTWQELPAPGLVSFFSVAVAPSSAGDVYAGGTGVSKSSDAGATWQQVNNGLPVNPPSPLPPSVMEIVWHPFDSRIGYLIASGYGVFRTVDAGGNWSAVSPAHTSTGPLIDQLAISDSSPSVLYAASSAPQSAPLIYRTEDGGNSWTTTSFPQAGAVTAIVVDPKSPDMIFVGTDGSGIFVSGDGGASWAPLNDGLADLHIHALAASPASPQTLFAAADAGVYQITRSLQALPPRPPPRVVTR
jgi:photosystem II stability/assembly factor-like uncharacterized protein